MLLNPLFGLTGDSLPSDALAPGGSDVGGNPFQEILLGVQQAQAGGQSSGSRYPSLAELIADVISAESPQSSAEGSQNPGLERQTSGHPHQGQTVKAQIEPEVPIEPGLTNGVTSVSPREQIFSRTLENPLALVTEPDPAVHTTTPKQTELRFDAESNHSGSGSESSSTSNHHPQPQLNTFADFAAAPTDEDAFAYLGPRPGIERDDSATAPSSRGRDIGSLTPFLMAGENRTNTQGPHVLSDRVTEALADPADADGPRVSVRPDRPVAESGQGELGLPKPDRGWLGPTSGSHDSQRLTGPEHVVVSVSDRRSIVRGSEDSTTMGPAGQTSVLAEHRLRQAGSEASLVSADDLELAHPFSRQIDPSAGDGVQTEVPVRNDRGGQPMSADPSSNPLDTDGGMEARTISGLEQALNALDSSELTREALTRDVVTTMNAHQNFHGEMGHGADLKSASADLLRSMEGMAERRSVVTHPLESSEQDQTLITGIRQGSPMPGRVSSGPAETLDAPRTLVTLPRGAEVVPPSGMDAGDTAANVQPGVSTDSSQRSRTTNIETETFVNRYRVEGSEGGMRREIVRNQLQDGSVRNDHHTTRDTTSVPAILDRARVVMAGSGQTEQSPVADTALQDQLPAERSEAQIIRSIPTAPEPGSIPSIGVVRGSHEGTPSVDLSDQPTPQPTDVEESKVTYQIVRGARFLTREGANQVTLRLDPPELGEVTIRLSSTDKSLTGEIRVESRMVQEIVNRNIGELRESLSSQGIKVEHLEVSVESGGRSGVDRDGSTAFHRESADRNRQPASDRHSSPEQRDDEREQSPRQVVRDGKVDFVA